MVLLPAMHAAPAGVLTQHGSANAMSDKPADVQKGAGMRADGQAGEQAGERAGTETQAAAGHTPTVQHACMTSKHGIAANSAAPAPAVLLLCTASCRSSVSSCHWACRQVLGGRLLRRLLLLQCCNAAKISAAGWTSTAANTIAGLLPGATMPHTG